MNEYQMMDAKIVEAVRVLCCVDRLGCPVLPFDVWSYGDEFRVFAHEGTIRRHMARLADEGRLIRVGERKGYIVPDWRRMTLPEVVDFGGSRSEWVSFEYDLLDDEGWADVG